MSPQTTGRALAVLILLIVFVPLIFMSIWQPVTVGLPTLVFALTGVYVVLHNRRSARR